jgi:hypothetical protein
MPCLGTAQCCVPNVSGAHLIHYLCLLQSDKEDSDSRAAAESDAALNRPHHNVGQQAPAAATEHPHAPLAQPVKVSRIAAALKRLRGYPAAHKRLSAVFVTAASWRLAHTYVRICFVK